MLINLPRHMPRRTCPLQISQIKLKSMNLVRRIGDPTLLLNCRFRIRKVIQGRGKQGKSYLKLVGKQRVLLSRGRFGIGVLVV